MIGDLLFVVRALVYSVVIALFLQVQWKGESLEHRTFRAVAESNVGGWITDTAQRLAYKFNLGYSEAAGVVSWKGSPGANQQQEERSKSRQLIQLKRSSQYQESSGDSQKQKSE